MFSLAFVMILMARNFPLQGLSLDDLRRELKENPISGIEKLHDAYFNGEGVRDTGEGELLIQGEEQSYREKIEKLEWIAENFYCLALLSECRGDRLLARKHGASAARINPRSFNILFHYARLHLVAGSELIGKVTLCRLMYQHFDKLSQLKALISRWNLGEGPTEFVTQESLRLIERKVERELEQLEEAFIQNNGEQMESMSATILEQIPHYPAVHRLMGRFYFRETKYEKAMEQFKAGLESKLIKLPPLEELELKSHLAKALILSDHPTEAIPVLTEILEGHPGVGEFPFLLAYAVLASGDLERAEKEYRHLFSASAKSDGRALCGAILTRALAKNFTGMEEDIEILKGIDPENQNFLWSIVYAHLMEEDFGKAQAAMATLQSKLKENSAFLDLLQGFCLYKRGQPSYENNFKRNQDDLVNYPEMKEVCYRIWLKNNQFQELIQGVNLLPAAKMGTEEYKILAYAYGQMMQYEQALSTLELAKKSGASDSEIALEQGRLLLVINETDQGKMALGELINGEGTDSATKEKARNYMEAIETGNIRLLEKGMTLDKFRGDPEFNPVPYIKKEIRNMTSFE